jgi:hypothetical protein
LFVLTARLVGRTSSSYSAATAAWEAAYPSRVIFSGAPHFVIAGAKKRFAAAISRCSLKRKATVCPALSTARYKETHFPFTFRYVSSTHHEVPTGYS